MKIDEIIENIDDLLNTSIDVEGYIIVIERAKRQVAFLSSTQAMSDLEQEQLVINHTIPELKAIIRPLPTLQLLFRGIMTNPPYIYNFYANFKATLVKDDDDTPTLQQITDIEINIPYAGKMSEFVPTDSYHYHASIDYTAIKDDDQHRTAQGTITSQKIISLSDTPEIIDTIMIEENRYARRLTGNTIRVTGWLESIPSQTEAVNHLIMRTNSIRLSIIPFGSSYEEVSIWLPPSELYKVIKTLSTHKPDEPLRQAIEIIGTMDYISDEDAPKLEEKSPKLVFTDLFKIMIQDTNYLW